MIVIGRVLLVNSQETGETVTQQNLGGGGGSSSKDKYSVC